MLTRSFWKDALERAVKTFAQTAAALLTADGVGLTDVNWIQIVSVAGMAAVVSILTSVASAPVGTSGTASVVHLEIPPK